MSSSGVCMTPSLAANAASPGKPSGAVVRHVAWLAIALAVAVGTRSAALRIVLLAAFRQAVNRMAGLQVMRVSLMNGAPCPLGWRCRRNRRVIGVDLLVSHR
jgi:hypothetical protein